MTTKDTIQIKNRYTGDVIFECEAPEGLESGLHIRHALGKAAASGANLGGAYLRDADLSDADLSDGAKLTGQRPIFMVGPIGSRSDFLVAYITDQGLRFDAGCQRQITREVFEARLTETHGDNAHAKEYRAALAFVDAHAEIWGQKGG